MYVLEDDEKCHLSCIAMYMHISIKYTHTYTHLQYNTSNSHITNAKQEMPDGNKLCLITRDRLYVCVYVCVCMFVYIAKETLEIP